MRFSVSGYSTQYNHKVMLL